MADFKLKLQSSVPTTLSYRAIVLVGSAGDYKIYAGDSNNNPVQVTPTLPKAQVESVSIVTSDSPYTATTNALRNIILADATNGAITVNLPPAADWADQFITVKKFDANANDVTIQCDGTETIEGSNSIALAAQWAFRTIFSDGNQLVVISSN